MQNKRHNLRSKKKESSIPKQLQLASNEDFMAALRHSTSWQVSYSEHTYLSDSDTDISDMINHSDKNSLDPVSGDVKGSTGQGQGPPDHGYS